MGMSVKQGQTSVKSEPNVVPMIDIMLVLLIIFMIVTPALASGFQAEPPEGVNLKAHPEDEELDQVLGIDRGGNYYYQKKAVASKEDLAAIIKNVYDNRQVDKILYLKADKTLQYEKVIDAMDIAARNGVRVLAAIAEQEPGTESTVEGDVIKTTNR
jgi:biopolymer transport protein ExbD